MERVVGIGQYAISNNKEDVIKTYALASCVAVTVYSPTQCVAAMAHIVLPCHTLPYYQNSQQPCYYATVGVPLLIHKMCLEFGCFKNELVIELFGGARSIKENDVFHIGYKNIITTEKLLKDLNLDYTKVETGGVNSRTIELDVATGKKSVAMQPLII